MSTLSPRSEVRQRGRSARQLVIGAARISATNALIGHLKHLHSITTAASVGIFVADDGEPDLTALVEWLWATGARVSLPVLRDDPSDHSMRFVPWHASDVLTPARYGIPIPPPRQPIEPEILLVSFVGFDAHGNRIGRGGGFFDRYLATTAAVVVGVGFEAQRFSAIPVEPHDVKLPTVVTDLGTRHLS